MITISDPFTGTNGTALSAHAFPGGYSWVQDLSSPSGDLQIQSNEIVTTAPSGGAVFYHASAIPGSADVTVRGVFDWSGATPQFFDLIARAQSGNVISNRYYARYSASSQTWGIFKGIGGTDTQIGGNTAVGSYLTLEFVLSGTSLVLNGDIGGGMSTVLSVTDSAISSAGLIGMAYPLSIAASAKPLITTFEADAVSWSGTATTANFHLMRRRNRR